MSKTSINMLLLVEDNPGDARLLREMLNEQGSHHTELTHVECMCEAEKYLAERAFDLILLDLGLSDAQGLVAVRRAHAAGPRIPLVVLTGLDDESLAVQALQEGAQDYLIKGQIETRGLLRALRYAIERKSMEGRLLASEEEYRLLFDSSPHPVWVYDVETLAFLAVNGAAVQLYGFSRDEFLGMTIKEICPPDEMPALLEYLAKMPDLPTVLTTHRKHRKKDGSILEIAAVSNPIAFHGKRARLVLANDVTETKRLEAQLLQAQRMEAVGRLAGGVAHDFNNALGVILGYTELLMRQAGETQRSKLEQILKATRRASGLTRQLLAFSRKQVVDPKVLDLNALLSDVEKMLGRLIGENLDLAIVPGVDLGQVKADPGQLEQVVMNLCVNARDAMPDGGLLRIETANAELDKGHATQHEPVAPGRYVMLAFSDTGSGIEQEILPKIFEPFFTTKELGKGTGLGLAMVYGIVKQAGGYVWVYSELGRGTTFKIYLPRVDEPVVAPEVQETPMPPKGWETILLVEDEGPLRAMTREILEEHGYRAIEAAGASEAIEIAHRHPEPIHLLLTDVVMPGMNGRELAQSLVAARPELRVLYMSGYTDDVIAHSGVLESGTLLLEKPFTAVALLGRVRATLGERGTGQGSTPRSALAGRERKSQEKVCP